VFSVFYLSLDLINKLRHTVPIIEISLVICGYQWIVGPFLLYLNINNNSYYTSALFVLGEAKYMQLTVLPYLAFILGLMYKKTNLVIEKETIVRYFSIKRHVQLLIVMFFVCVLCYMMQSSVFQGIAYILNTLGNCMIVFSIILLYTSTKFKWIYLIIALCLSFLHALQATVYASFIQHLLIVFIFIPNVLSLSRKKIIIITIAGVVVVSFLQEIKIASRLISEIGKFEISDLGKAIDIMKNSGSDETMLQRSSSGTTNAMIFVYVPQYTPHTYGKTMIEDLSYALVPSLFMTDKLISTNANYMKYTGNYVDDSTSVGVNPLGLSYAEFGAIGSIIFMFIYGFLIKLCFLWIEKRSRTNIFFIFLSVIILGGIIKGESEVAGVVNGVLKNIIIVWLLNLLLIKIFNKSPLYNNSLRNPVA
jgi:hypothetical protein